MLLYLGLVVAAYSVLGAEQSEGNQDLPMVSGSSYLGVIFPADRAHEITEAFDVNAHEYWAPSTEDIDRMERHVRDALRRFADDPSLLDKRLQKDAEQRAYISRQLRGILEHLGDYRRQYAGFVTRQGARRVLINAFIGQYGQTDVHSYWRRRVVLVFDGGYDYWRLQYDVAADRYFLFDSNGYA